MSDILLNKLINDEFKPGLLIKWLLMATKEDNREFVDISACKVGQIDFITYFLNFLHEELPCNDTTETPSKPYNTPKRLSESDTQYIKNPSREPSDIKSNLSRPLLTNTDSYTSTQLNSSLDTSHSKFSTPKPSGINKNDSYFSPVSPLYQNPNSNQNRSIKKSAEKPSLCLGDFLVSSAKTSAKKKRQSLDLSSSKKESSRRIKPTDISVKPTNASFQRSENSFNFQENAAEVPVKTVSEIRGILAEERTKILFRKDSLETSTHQILLKRQNSLPKSNSSPLHNLVTFQTNLDNVASVYKAILDHKLVLNITSELYFLISLVLSKQIDTCTQKHKLLENGEANDSTDSNLGVAALDHNSSLSNLVDGNQKNSESSLFNSEIFGTIHNVVYFAVKCLESQFEILKVYDKTTLRLLADNKRIKEFSSKFSKKLQSSSEKKTEKLCLDISTPITQTGNVCFNIDTDNAENFPDQLSFHAFRKQRDMFYEILRVWETSHLLKDWSFSLGLGGKIRSLFSFHNGPTNYTHLARLFKNQLLRSCAKGPKEKGLSETSLPFIPSLDIDADKLKRLTRRLVTKQSSNGINSLPVFSGYQEFFKDFVVVSSNPFFNRHICDSFTSEILELNDTKLSTVELEDKGNEVDQNTRKLYIDCIQNLRILAKFLGFIESLPYKSELLILPKNVVEAQIKIRKQYAPQLDVKQLLQQSISVNSVIFIVPWIIKYLAMIDYVTLRLPYYRSVHTILFDLYRNYENAETTIGNAACVRFCLGWLFELPHFPDAEYFSFCLQNVQACTEKTHRTKLRVASLDSTDIINQNVLYLCCPYLEEIKKVLSTNAPSKVAVKYITPVTAVESNVEVARKKMEQQVEDAFFNSQPASLRKTVEFVSERIASAAVKHICHDLVPNFKIMALKEFKELLLKNDGVDSYSDDSQRKTTLKNQGLALCQSQISSFLNILRHEAEKISFQKIPLAIGSLLPVDTLEETKKICIRITNKMYIERVKQWIDSHVNLALLSKEFESEVQKKILNGRRNEKDKIPFVLPPGGRNCNHNENALSGFHALNALAEACCRVNERNGITIEYVVNVLQETQKSLTERNDINDTITASITLTVFEFCLLLISRCPSLLSTEIKIILSHCLTIWTLDPRPQMLFKSLFCPRNLRMVQRSPSKMESICLYARVISTLLEKKLINVQDLESQCTGFYSKDWDKITLEDFSYLLKQLVSYYDSIDYSLAALLDFLSDFCSDL